MNDILVTIFLCTYQHEKYIEKSIESILNQNVDFKYEILIADDCSYDKTPYILCKYKKMYPEKIKLILRKTNLGATRNTYYSLQHARGKYIAFIEGDDYWTDEAKIRKQVNFLEENSQYMGIFHKCKLIDQNEKKLALNYYTIFSNKRIYSIKDLEEGILPGQASTLMSRNFFLDNRRNYNFYFKVHPYIGDITLYSILLSFGNLYILQEEMGIYRIVKSKKAISYSSKASNNNLAYENWIYFYNLEKYLKKIMKKNYNFKKMRKGQFHNSIDTFRKQSNIKNFRVMMRIIISSLECEIFHLR